MLNEAQLSLTGYVASDPRSRATRNGTPQVSMRVAWTPRWIDRSSGEWADGTTSYLTVICWRRLATNVATCIRKGDPVVVKGRLSIRPYEDKDGNSRLAIEVEAGSVGHDLSRGVATFQRTRPPAGDLPPLAPAGALSGDGFMGGGFGSAQADGSNGLDVPSILDEAAIAALLPESSPSPELVPDGEPVTDGEPVPAGV
jgi:single-strand DNA-binding protein